MAVEKTSNTSSLAEYIDRILDKGITLNSTENFCCPDCDANRYVLSSVETYLKYAEAVGLTESAAVPAAIPFGETTIQEPKFVKPCCRNVRASVETYLKYAEAVGLTQSAAVPPALPFFEGKSITQTNNNGFGSSNSCLHPVEIFLKEITNLAVNGDLTPDCNNGFDECFQELGNIVNLDRLLDKGLIEEGTILGDTKLCTLVNFFKNNDFNLDQPNSSTLDEIMDRILDKGIIIDCNQGTLTISSVETYLKYAEAVGLTQSAAVPA